jgi:hypothetical protein
MDIIGTGRTIGMHPPTITHARMTPGNAPRPESMTA